VIGFIVDTLFDAGCPPESFDFVTSLNAKQLTAAANPVPRQKESR
jgi:hypothetical protein